MKQCHLRSFKNVSVGGGEWVTHYPVSRKKGTLRTEDRWVRSQ